MDEQRNDEPEAPAKLREALSGLRKEAVFIPPSVDRAVLEKVRPHLANVRMQRARWKPASRWMAIAASIVLAFGVSLALYRSGFLPERFYAREDVNHDGRVDILDAFQLTRELGKNPSARDDVNHDGKVDEADVQIIAQRAVKLGGRS